MKPQKPSPPLSEVYRTAWESCVALWPLFIVRLVFLVLNIGALVLCLFLACWPFIRGLMTSYRNSGESTVEKFIQNLNPADLAQYFPDIQTILMAIGLGLLYITWWSFLAALFDGAVYSRLRDNQLNQSLFSLPEFFKDGLKYMMPMLGLQVAWFAIFMGVLFILFMVGLIAVVLLNVMNISPLFIFLPGIPAGFAALVLLVAIGGYGVVSGAYLVEDKGVLSALKRSFEKCVAGHGRVIWGILLVWVIYFVFSIAFQGVMTLFGAIPIIGLLFTAVEFIINIALSIAIWVYMPALAVVFSLED